MIHLSKEALARWRMEIDLGVEFRDKEFGTYRQQQAGSAPQTTLAGRNLDLFEQGGRSDGVEPPLNIVFPIVKNVLATQFFQAPKVMAKPTRKSGVQQDDAHYVAEAVNKDLRDPSLRIEQTSKQCVFDGYVLASGLVKIGYATEFGQDILRSEAEEKAKQRGKLRQAVTQMVNRVLGKPVEPPVEPEVASADEAIKSESPYIQYVSPFDFVIDPRARDIYDARWVAQRIRRTLAEVKADKRYGAAKHELEAEALADNRIDDSMIEDFQGVDIWEVHYKNPESPTGVTLLSFAALQEQNKALIHDHNVYDLGGWQYEWLTQNKHGHRLYPVSTVSIIRPLVDRINSTLDSVLERIDKFVAKIVYNELVTPEGEMALDDPTIGNRIKVAGKEDVAGAIRVLEMQQVAADLLGLINQVVDFVILITGLTRAQLTGLTTAQTATEAQIGQSGQNLRRTDESNVVSDWFKRVITKYWKVKAQFQDLTEIDLMQETTVLDPTTGMNQTQWYPPIDPARAERLKRTRFDFELEPYATQKPNLEIIRAQFEGFMRALMEPVVTNGLALEGNRVSASEAVKQWSRFFIEAGLPGLEKLIVPINDPLQQQALLTFGQKPEAATGGNGLQGPQNRADLISAAAGPKGQGMSPA